MKFLLKTTRNIIMISCIIIVNIHVKDVSYVIFKEAQSYVIFKEAQSYVQR